MHIIEYTELDKYIDFSDFTKICVFFARHRFLHF